jgi:hypothetical protein
MQRKFIEMTNNNKIYKMTDKSKSLGKEIGIITLLLAVIGFILYLLILQLVNYNPNQDLLIFFLSWSGIFLMIYVLVTWNKLTGTLFSLYTIFILFFFLFNFGQCLMWGFGIHLPTEIGQIAMYPGFAIPSGSDIVKAQALVLISILMFHTGAVYCYKGRSNSKETQIVVNSEDTKTLKSIYYVSMIVGIIVIPISLYYSYSDFQISRIYGYKALYYSDFTVTGASFTGLLSRMFFPCLVGLLIGSRYNKKVQLFVYGVFTIYFLLNLFSGDRGSWLYKIIILVWLSHTCNKPINIKKSVKYIVFSIIGLYVINGIISFRDIGLSNINLETFLNSISFENSPIITAIFEMGSSMKPTIILQKYGWQDWPYNNTYLLGILGMITNRFIYLLGMSFTLPSAWFSQEYLGISWGAGFSIIAESILNVGPIFAPLILLIQGYVISTMIYVDKGMNFKGRPLRFFFAAATLHNLIPILRNELHVNLKDWFYGVLIMYILILVFRKLIFVKTRKNY